MSGRGALFRGNWGSCARCVANGIWPTVPESAPCPVLDSTAGSSRIGTGNRHGRPGSMNRWLNAAMAAFIVVAIAFPLALYSRMNHIVPAAVPNYSTEGIASHLDECRFVKGRIYVRGWAFLEKERQTTAINVHVALEGGGYLKVPSRIAWRQDVADRFGREDASDPLFDGELIFDGFSAGAGRLGQKITVPLQVLLTRADRNGRLHGAVHVCQ